MHTQSGHVSNYYPGSEVITDDEANKVQAFAEKIGLDVENTRCAIHSLLIRA
jgi:hypothetical protein